MGYASPDQPYERIEAPRTFMTMARNGASFTGPGRQGEPAGRRNRLMPSVMRLLFETRRFIASLTGWNSELTRARDAGVTARVGLPAPTWVEPTQLPAFMIATNTQPAGTEKVCRRLTWHYLSPIPSALEVEIQMHGAALENVLEAAFVVEFHLLPNEPVQAISNQQTLIQAAQQSTPNLFRCCRAQTDTCRSSCMGGTFSDQQCYPVLHSAPLPCVQPFSVSAASSHFLDKGRLSFSSHLKAMSSYGGPALKRRIMVSRLPFGSSSKKYLGASVGFSRSG